MKIFTEYFKDRKLGFFFSFAFAIITLITSFLYLAALKDNLLFKPLLFVLPLIGSLAFLGLSLIKNDKIPTYQIGVLILGILNFVAFIYFMNDTYGYYLPFFIDGVDFTAQNTLVFITTGLYVLNFIATDVMVWIECREKSVKGA